MSDQHDKQADRSSPLAIEEMVCQWEEPQRSQLLARLVEMEVRRLRAEGRAANREDYLRRFPADEAVISTVFDRLNEDQATLAHPSGREPGPSVDLAETIGNLPETRPAAGGPSPSSDAPIELPQVPGYEVLEFIARGGMGVVLKARHVLLDRLVALKVPLDHQIASPDDRERFLREARSAAQLRHPNICPIHDVGEANGRPYLAMTYIAGATLKDWAQREQPSARQVAHMVAVLSRAVHYAHRHGVVHRDLKPSNVMVEDEGGQPVLMDFGLAKQITEGASGLTQSGQVMGTPAYMAPEQAAGDHEAIGPLSDVYSLGAILYELLCGRPPFTGNVGEVLRKVETADPPPPRSQSPHLHRDIETICLKALSKEPRRRYQTAEALAEDLERFNAGEAILARREGVVGKLWRKARRSPLAIAATLLLLITAAVAGYFAYSAGDARRIAELNQAFETGMDARQWPPRHVAAMEDLIGQMENVAPEQVAAARDRLYQRFAEFHRSRLRQARVSEEDARQTEQAIALLEQRAAPLAASLRNALEQRLGGWQTEFDLTPAGDLASLFSPDEVLLQDGDLRINPEMRKNYHADAMVNTRVACSGNLQVQAEFGGDWEKAKELGVLINSNRRHRSFVDRIAVSPDGGRVASGDRQGRAILWRSDDGEVLHAFPPGRNGVTSLQFSPDGSFLLVANAQISFWDVKTGEEMDLLAKKPGWAHCARISPDGRQLAVGKANGLVEVWDLRQAKLARTLAGAEHGQRRPVQLLRYAPDGRLISVASDGSILAWPPDDQPPAKFAPKSDDGKGKDQSVPVAQIVFINQAKSLGVLRKGGRELEVYDLADGRPQPPLEFERQSIAAVAASPTGDLLAVSSIGSMILSRGTGERPRVLRGVQARAQALAFSPNGESLYAGEDAGTISKWDVASGRSLRQMRNAHFAFVIRPPKLERGAVTARAARDKGESRTFAEARKAGAGMILELVRDGAAMQSRHVETIPPAGGPVRLLATREGARLSLQVNNGPPLEFFDPFPVRGNRGVFGLVWPVEATLERFQARRQALPPAASPLEKGDELYDQGQFDEAIALYEQQALAAGDGKQAVAQEARYKQGLCLRQLGRESQAETLFRRLASESGRRWPLLAACQVWSMTLQKQDGVNEADAVFESFAARYRFEQFAVMVPADVRDAILEAYGRRASGTSWYRPDPHRIAGLKRAQEVELLWFGAPSFRTQWSLCRAYHAANQIDEAIAHAGKVIRDAEQGGLRVSYSWLADYAWLLTVKGEPGQAEQFLSRWIAGEGTAEQRDRDLLYLPRARVQAARGQWDDARRDIEELFRRRELKEMVPVNLSASLVRGLLREQHGDVQGARQAWRAGLDFAGSADPFGFGFDFLERQILASLLNELSDEQAEDMTAKLMNAFTGESPVGVLKTLIRLPPAVMRGMWQTERGKQAARRLAYRQAPFPEQVRLPAMLLGTQFVRHGTLGDKITAEQEELLWKLGETLYADYMSGKFKLPQIVQTGMTWKGQRNFLGWGALAPTLEPQIRGPLAYFFGHRYLRLKRKQEAAAFFQEAMEKSDDALLKKLCQAALRKLAGEKK